MTEHDPEDQPWPILDQQAWLESQNAEPVTGKWFADVPTTASTEPTTPDRAAVEVAARDLGELADAWLGWFDGDQDWDPPVSMPERRSEIADHLRQVRTLLDELNRSADYDAVCQVLDETKAELERLTTERDKARIDAAELLDALETTSDDADGIADQRADYREEVMRLRGKVEWLGRVGRVEQERDDRKSLRLAYLRKIVMISYRNGWADAIETAGYETAKRSEQNAKEFATKFLAEVVEAEAADLAARDEREGGS